MASVTPRTRDEQAIEWLQSNDQVPYRQALETMELRNAAVASGQAAELIWLLDHPPVYTAGTSADPKELTDPQFEVIEAGRGGRYTYHGPGQRVGYLVLDLNKRGKDVRCFVHSIEGWVIETLRVIADYRHAADNAKKAGFDGVQLHGANGYLIDQFLRDSSNLRTDEYGGSPKNRTRFMREVLEALIDVWGADRVGIRLSPNGETQGCDDSDPAATFGEAAKVIEELGLAFLELREPGPDGTFGSTDVPKQSPMIRSVYSGPLILNSDYGASEATEDVESGKCDAVSFGRPYISNPDLEKRIAADADFNPNKDVPKSWYFPIPEGYIDYPTLAEERASDAA